MLLFLQGVSGNIAINEKIIGGNIMKKIRKIICFILCLTAILSLTIVAFADSEFSGDDTSKDNTTITLYNHTDVIMRSYAGTSASKVHTLYVGDSAYIYNWQTNQYLINGYYWAYLRHYDSGSRTYYYGYSANAFLS